jgi:hypothetical protein
VTSIPAGATVVRCDVNITTKYSGGTKITVGRAGALTLLQDTTDNHPDAIPDDYPNLQVTPWGGVTLPVVVTILGGPVVGAGNVAVLYCQPLP